MFDLDWTEAALIVAIVILAGVMYDALQVM